MYIRFCYVLSFALTLSACGGGGKNNPSIASGFSSNSSLNSISSSNSSSQTTNTPKSQKFSFLQQGTFTLLPGEDFINAASGEGTGKVSYFSDNPAVASVDANGKLSLLSEGNASIRAQIAADPIYLAAEASYTIKVIPKDIPVTAWIGEKDTLLNFPSTANGFTLYKSSDYRCNFDNYLACINGQMDILNGSTITDLITTQSRAAFYQLHTGNKKAKLGVSIDTFHADNIQITEFKDQLWMIDYDNWSDSNSIWSSSDGVTWTKKKITIPFSARRNFQLVAFENQLWVIGGRISSRLTNEIWSSIDGIQWTLANASPPFSARYLHKAITFKNRLWLIGGSSTGFGQSFKNDVWSSKDGIEWIQHTNAAEFSPRAGHEIIIHQGKLWLIGGINPSSFNDVWTSDDAITWHEVTNAAEFSPRYLHQIVSFQNKLWLIGGSATGSDFSRFSDIWFSSDGKNWSNQTDLASFGGKQGHQLKFFMNKFFIYGGGNNDIWTSKNLSEWNKEESRQINIEAIFDQTVYYNHRYWLIGGDYRRGKTNTVWTSNDGLDWKLEKKNAEFTARNGHSVLLFNNKIWLIGGEDEFGLQNDIWSSTDGITWIKNTEGAAFAPRKNHKLLSHKNELFLFGGNAENDTWLNDIWSSTDGSIWVKKTDNASFPKRRYHQIVSYIDRIWVIGGETFGDSLANDSWSSFDGVDWHRSQTNITSRYHHQSIVFRNQILLIGGMDENYMSNNDIWFSIDGISWQQLTDLPFTHRAGHKVLSNGENIILIGGAGLVDDTSFSDLYSDVWSSTDAIKWRKGFKGTFKFAN